MSKEKYPRATARLNVVLKIQYKFLTKIKHSSTWILLKNCIDREYKY